MRIHTSIVAAIVTLAFAGPAVAATQTGASAIPGGCVQTMSDGYIWGYDCSNAVTGGSNTTAQGVSTTQAAARSCTLTIATSNFWTYGCPSGKTGMSKGAIPASCKATLATGYLWMFSCPSSAFRGSGTTVKAGSKAQAGSATGTLRSCAGTLSDRRLSGLLCIL